MEKASMKRIVAIALAASAATFGMTLGSTAAEARQGCGRDFHRGYYGRCIPNRYYRPGVVGRPVVGIYYGNRGWWDGHRYWRDRYRHHGGWRYR
jgi:hypothetical protein